VRQRVRHPVRGFLGRISEAVRSSRTRTLTGAASDYALPPLLLCETGHEVVSAPDLEAEDLLEILALEPDLVAELCAEIGGEDEGCLLENVIDFCGENETQIVWRLRWQKAMRRESWIQWRRRIRGVFEGHGGTKKEWMSRDRDFRLVRLNHHGTDSNDGPTIVAQRNPPLRTSFSAFRIRLKVPGLRPPRTALRQGPVLAHSLVCPSVHRVQTPPIEARRRHRRPRHTPATAATVRRFLQLDKRRRWQEAAQAKRQNPRQRTFTRPRRARH